MFGYKCIINFLTVIILSFIFSHPSFSDNHSKDLKKINEQLNSVKKLFDTGVLDQDSYKTAKDRLDEKKNILLSKNKKKLQPTSTISKTLEKQIEVLEKLFNDGVLSEEELLKTKKLLIEKEKGGTNISLDDYKSASSYILNRRFKALLLLFYILSFYF